MKKFVWVLLIGMLCASFNLIGCKADDVEKDRLVGAEVLRIEDIVTEEVSHK
jgi:hypothetical protein